MFGFGNNMNAGYNNFGGGMNQGMNQGYAPQMSQEEQSLVNLLFQCTQGGSYPNLAQNQQLFISIFRETKRESQTFSAQKDNFPTPNFTQSAVSFCGTVVSNYKGNKYDIFTKIMFPPQFPNQAPILSVLNIDPTTFSVNQKFNRNILPDGTFEVKLDSSRNWVMQKNFTALFNEYRSIIAIDFPFFKTQNITPPPPAPKFYDVPGGMGQGQPQNFNAGNNMSSWGGNNQPMASNWGQPNINPYAQNQGFGAPAPVNNYNPNAYSNFGTQNQNIYSGLDGNVRQQIRETLNGLHFSIKKDIQDSQNTFNELIKIKGEHKMLEKQIKTTQTNLSSQRQKNEDNTFKLVQYHSSYENVSLDNPEVLNRMMAKDKKSDTLIDTLSDLRSNEEINAFFTEQYIEGKINLPFDDILLLLEKRYKNEFTSKCALRDLLSG